MTNRERIAIARAEATGGKAHLVRVFNKSLQTAGGGSVGKRELVRRIEKARAAVRETQNLALRVDIELAVLEIAAPLFRGFGISDEEGRDLAARSGWNIADIRKEIATGMAKQDEVEIDSIQGMPTEQRGSLAANMKKKFDGEAS
ncbi:MAG: hypothetical protein RJS97_14405 [Parvibaculaceae bacterium]